MVQKMLFCFTDISPAILLHILGYSFCKELHILVRYLASYLTFKRIKNYLHKSFFAWASKMLLKMTPESITMGTKTLSIMPFSIMTFSKMTFCIMTFSIITFSIMTFSIMTISITINKTWHSHASLICWVNTEYCR